MKAETLAALNAERAARRPALVVTDMAGPDTIKGADSAPAVVTVWITP